MLHNKFTKAGDLPNKFTYYVSSTCFFCKIKDRWMLKLDLYKKNFFFVGTFILEYKIPYFIGTEICLQASHARNLFVSEIKKCSYLRHEKGPVEYLSL